MNTKKLFYTKFVTLKVISVNSSIRLKIKTQYVRNFCATLGID